MDKRRQDLNYIRDYIQNTDKELTLLLHNLQWDHKHIVEKPTLSSCSIDPSHRIPEGSRNVHERRCFLTRHGYAKDEEFLPDPLDINTNTVVKYSTRDIQNIINAAAYNDPLFKRVVMLTFLANTRLTCKGNQGPEPLTVGRLQATYEADERRVIHDAVVDAAPFAHDLADLALGSNTQEGGRKSKTRAEVMAELRDMRRRRTKYRVPSKTTNYSHVLKGVIKSQMDLYAETNGIFIKTEYGSKSFVSLNDERSLSNQSNTAPKVVIKRERISPELENTRNMRYAQDKGRHSVHQHEHRPSSRDRERHTYTRHTKERDARSYDSRHKCREQNKYERRPRDYRNDADERFAVIKQEIISPEPESTRNIRYVQDKDRHSSHRHEDRTTSKDKERPTDTRHMKERDPRSYDSRQKHREQNKYERRSRDYRNDAGERFDTYKERVNEQSHDKYHRTKIKESYNKHYRNDNSSSSGESRDREIYDRSKEHSSSRSDRDGRYDKNYQNVRVKEEKDDYYEGRKKMKYN